MNKRQLNNVEPCLQEFRGAAIRAAPVMLVAYIEFQTILDLANFDAKSILKRKRTLASYVCFLFIHCLSVTLTNYVNVTILL
jgi:hypothetical protein